MGERKKIRLSAPFEWHGQSIVEIELREPSGWEAATIGEPRVLVHTAGVGGYLVELPDRIAKYLDKCVTHESGADVVKNLSLGDVLKVKGALFDFFIEAEAKIVNEKLASFASAQNESRSAKSAT